MADALIENPILKNKTVNRIRQRVGMWREGGYVGVTRTTAALLRYWTDTERERKKKEKAAKVMTARTLWVPAVNNHGAFGRWAFLEVIDPYDVLKPIRSLICGQPVANKKGDKE